MAKFVLNNVEYQIPELDMNFLIEMDDYGLSYDDIMGGNVAPLKLYRAILAWCGKITLTEAGVVLQKAMLSKELNALDDAIQKAFEDSGFFRELQAKAEESQGEELQPSETETTEPKLKSTTRKVKATDK